MTTMESISCSCTVGDGHCQSIASVLAQAAAARPATAAIELPGGATIGAADLFERVMTAAAELQRQGSRGGASASRVAIVLPNGPDLSLTMLAAASVGTAVPLNPAYRREEYEAYFRIARVDVLLVDPAMGGAAIDVATALGIRVLHWGSDVTGSRTASPLPLPPVAADDVAVVMLTSGSTGRAKVVPLTHRNLCAGAAAVVQSVGLGSTDRVLCMWEQFHIGGIVDLLLAPLLAGGTVIAAGSFDAGRFFEQLDVARPTWFQGVPTTLRELCHHARCHGLTPAGSSLRFIRSVAAALPPALMAEVESLFGVPVIQTFGMTEAAPLITSTRLPPAIRKPGSAGTACGADVRIVDDDGRPRAAGIDGHVAIRGPNVFAGYEADPEANAQAFRDGWFLTGDLGSIDADGDLFLAGRVKELINRGGEKITPREVDDALLAHPAVEEAATFALPHPTLGEDVAAAVVLYGDVQASVAELQQFVADRLAAFKVPRRILVLDSLPRCPVGKVRRRELAELCLRQPAASQAPPTTGLEAALVRIWADELDVTEIGIDDDFAAAGGDSLSAVRVAVAAEELCGVTLGDQAVARSRTIRSMAARLMEAGCPSEPPFIDREASPSGERSRLLDTATHAIAAGGWLPDDLLIDCPSVLAFETARHAAETIATPAELQALVARRPRRGVRNIAAALTSPITSFRLRRRRIRFAQDVRRALQRAELPFLWQRKAVTDHLDLFSSADARPETQTLVVAFAGRTMRLMTPTHHVLGGLSPVRHDLLLVRDPHRSHYRDGIPGMGGDLAAVARSLARYVADSCYRRVVALGTSAGGVPAVCTAILNGWERVVACGTDRLTSHPSIRGIVEHCAQLHAAAARPDITLAYSGRNERDTDGACQMKALFPAARLFPDARFADHSLLYELHRRGELGGFLARELLEPGPCFPEARCSA
jgi:acyl-CoA synthetase (AMP-forming)/AMP-acid ligase II/acyl carrier protein